MGQASIMLGLFHMPGTLFTTRSTSGQGGWVAYVPKVWLEPINLRSPYQYRALQSVVFGCHRCNTVKKK